MQQLPRQSTNRMVVSDITIELAHVATDVNGSSGSDTPGGLQLQQTTDAAPSKTKVTDSRKEPEGSANAAAATAFDEQNGSDNTVDLAHVATDVNRGSASDKPRFCHSSRRCCTHAPSS